jgi:hypothetical protein
MSKTMIRLSMILLAVALTLTLAGVAEAGSLAPRKAPSFHKIQAGETGGLLTQAWSWLTTFWTGTTQILDKSGPATGTDTPETTTTTAGCTNPQGCGDAGYGLDPNG